MDRENLLPDVVILGIKVRSRHS